MAVKALSRFHGFCIGVLHSAWCIASAHGPHRRPRESLRRRRSRESSRLRPRSRESRLRSRDLCNVRKSRLDYWPTALPTWSVGRSTGGCLRRNILARVRCAQNAHAPASRRALSPQPAGTGICADSAGSAHGRTCERAHRRFAAFPDADRHGALLQIAQGASKIAPVRSLRSSPESTRVTNSRSLVLTRLNAF